MRKASLLTLLGAPLLLAACGGDDTTLDYGLDSGPISEMVAGIWVDPNGCDHWIIDDGVEGYMTPRLDANGIPKCREIEAANTTIDFERRVLGQN
jgi:hypothetical protein